MIDIQQIDPQNMGPPSSKPLPPKLVVLGGIYSFNWKQEQVQVIMERLREERNTITAEITVKGEPEGHMHMTKLNLMTTRSRSEITKYLRERCQRNRDWDAIVEQMCMMTIQKFRAGEPVVNLGDSTPPAEPVYRLFPWVVDGEPSIIYGEGGIGKSYLAGFMAAMVDQAVNTDFARPMPGKVLYLDFETTEDITARRFQSLTSGFGFEGKSNVMYRFCHQSLASDISEIQKIVAEENICLIVIDSAGPACGGDPETAQSAISYFTALRSLRKSSITIAHRSKSGSVGPFGSVYWVNYPRMAYELKKSQEEESDVMHVALIHKKVNDGRLQKPVSFKIEWHESGAVTVATEALENVPDFVTELPIADQCAVAFNEHGPKTVKELADITGQAPRSLSVTLSRSKTRFRRIGNQRWDNVE